MKPASGCSYVDVATCLGLPTAPYEPGRQLLVCRPTVKAGLMAIPVNDDIHKHHLPMQNRPWEAAAALDPTYALGVFHVERGTMMVIPDLEGMLSFRTQAARSFVCLGRDSPSALFNASISRRHECRRCTHECVRYVGKNVRARSKLESGRRGDRMKRTWTIIGVSDVTGSFKWYQALFGQPATLPAHDYFGQILDSDGTVLLCLHEWGAHEHPSLKSPDHGKPGNGLLLFFRVDDFDLALERARSLVTRLDEEPHVNSNTQTQEFSLRDPDGYYVTISALFAA